MQILPRSFVLELELETSTRGWSPLLRANPERKQLKLLKSKPEGGGVG
jgi:hypothetical protein